VPTYDYQCRTCGHTVEVIHGMTEEGPTACELCGGPLRRVLFPAGIIFKGSGFYRNDARAGSGGSSSSAKRPAGSEGSSSAPAATDGGAGGSPSASTSTDAAAPSTPTPSSD
jgi:putative FmdB family regulatory protein